MAGIFQGDIIILTAIQLGIEDMRKNEWLIDHLLQDLTSSVYLRQKYGQKQIDALKEWFRNNQIDIYMRPRDDRDRLPCITIEMGPSNEKAEMKHLGDLSPHKTTLIPNQIGKPIPYVIKPFIPTGYNETTGELSIPDTIDLVPVSAGMILVNPDSGFGFKILGLGVNSVFVQPNQSIASTQFGILPSHQYYQARVKHSFFEETYAIKCHAHGDIQNTLFLWSLVKYNILRYRQSLLEANGFAESSVSSGSPGLNAEWSTEGGEKAYTRGMTLSGQVQNTWIDEPHRYIETIALREKEECEYVGGIKIISNLNSPDFIAETPQMWTTVVDSPEKRHHHHDDDSDDDS